MRTRMVKGLGSLLVAGALLAGPVGAASAHPGKVNTGMRFHLASHDVAVGDTVSGPVHLSSRSHNHWVPMAGATLSVRVDGVDTGAPLTTDDHGDPTFQYHAAPA